MQRWGAMTTGKHWCWALLLGICCLGCGKPSSEVPAADDAILVESLITSLPDRAQSPEMFKETFVGGNAPPDASRQQIGGSQLSLSAPPGITDSTATASVLFQSPNGEESGPVTWELSKEGDTWKVKSAPVP